MGRGIMSVYFEITNKKEINNFLDSKKDNILEAANRGVARAALFMQNEVKSSIAGQRDEHTSVDTGRFMNSIDIEMGDRQAIVFTDIEYAQYLEYGTSRFSARAHFRNSLARNQDNIKAIILNEINI
jgi:phage gpG-like protein